MSSVSSGNFCVRSSTVSNRVPRDRTLKGRESLLSVSGGGHDYSGTPRPERKRRVSKE